MAQRYADGEVSQEVWKLYRLFEGGAVLSTADLRSALGVTKKAGASRADSAVKELQRQFYITVCGNRRKISYEGFEYGWPANTYCTIKAWAPENWLSPERIDPEDARSRILDIGCSIGRNIKRASLSKVLFNSDIY
jgi:hypothetical protein